MLLANASDKNVGQIVEMVATGNVMRYLKSLGREDEDDVIIYGKKQVLGEKYLAITLSNRLSDICQLQAWNEWSHVILQKINDRAKELGIDKVILFEYDDSFAAAKEQSNTIGLPTSLRIHNIDLCVMIVNLILASFYEAVDKRNLRERFNALTKVTDGTYRPDLPERVDAGEVEHEDEEEDEDREDGEDGDDADIYLG